MAQYLVNPNTAPLELAFALLWHWCACLSRWTARVRWVQAVDHLLQMVGWQVWWWTTIGNVEQWGLLANGQSCAPNHLEKRLGVGLLNRYVSLSVVFTLNIHLCLRTGGRWSKFVRVGYKASLSTDVCTQYRACNTVREQSDIGIQTNQQSWELLRSWKILMCRLVMALSTLRSVGFSCEQLPGWSCQ
jgi:hypothetical protein